MSYRPFSEDVWDYLGDMPYMPRRADRDELLASANPNRARIWDYFFRIQPEDIGKPHKIEIQATRLDLEREMQFVQGQVDDVQRDIWQLSEYFGKRLRRFLISGILALLIGSALGTWLFSREPLLSALKCAAPLWAIGIFLLLIAFSAWRNRLNQRKRLLAKIEALNQLNRRQIKAARNRVNVLEGQIEDLKQQIPTPPSDSQVRAWLDEDLIGLQQRCIEQTGLEDRLEPTEPPDPEGRPALTVNPIPVMGPGELQDSNDIPRSFTREENPDLNKHLTARRAYPLAGEQAVDVLYGVYYIIYIVVADALMATYGFFYDFIAGRQYAERETEQYYRDLIAITTTKESRNVMLGVDSEEYILIEDAPTFALSLPSNERRTVTFVNEGYFQGIRDKLGLTREQVRNIYWLQDADRTVENTIQILRRYLRRHKIEERSRGGGEQGSKGVEEQGER